MKISDLHVNEAGQILKTGAIFVVVDKDSVHKFSKIYYANGLHDCIEWENENANKETIVVGQGKVEIKAIVTNR